MNHAPTAGWDIGSVDGMGARLCAPTSGNIVFRYGRSLPYGDESNLRIPAEGLHIGGVCSEE